MSGFSARNSSVAARPFALRPQEGEEALRVAAGNTGQFWHAMSVLVPSGRWNFTAMPRGSSCAASGHRGFGLPLEKRTSTRIGSPCMCAARVSSRARGVAVDVPTRLTPLVCVTRLPGPG